MKKQTKKPNSFWLKNKQILCTALATIGLFLGLNYGVMAQNASYNSNSVPIGGYYSSAFGFQALKSNRGSANTANGFRALSSNTTGESNTANGYYALYSNTTGWYNTANGYAALFSNTTGYFNTANGADALSSNTTGWYNTANGLQALYSNSTGWYNTANGYRALSSNTTGWYNTANGDEALLFNTTGSNNTATGVSALFSNTEGKYNTANGDNALYLNTKGSGNTASGSKALEQNTEGNNNIAIGTQALQLNITGFENVALGYQTMLGNKTGVKNTAIGTSANVKGDVINSTAIGAEAEVDASNKIVLGNTSITRIGGYSNWFNLSDGRFKKDIQQNVPGLSFITKLNPVTYHLDIKQLNSFLGVDQRKTKTNSALSTAEAEGITAKEAICYTGFIAQEVEKAAEAVGYNFSGVAKPSTAKSHYSISYSDFVVPLVKAVQEQQAQIEEQKQINQQLQQRLEALEKMLANNGNNTIAAPKTSSEAVSSQELHLFPNPTTGVFTVTAEHINSGVIEVHNMAGNLIKQVPVKNKLVNYVLDFSSYAKGNYIVTVNAGGKKYTKQIVVQ